MVNVSLLRAIQASIMDQTRPFDMGDWGCCIAGHAYACINNTVPSSNSFVASKVLKEVGHVLGEMGIDLGASPFNNFSLRNREDAFRALEAIIWSEEEARACLAFEVEARAALHLPQESPQPQEVHQPDQELVLV